MQEYIWVTAILAAVGYNTMSRGVQTESALLWVRIVMSFLPAAVAVLSMLFVMVYPLTTSRMKEIQQELASRRK